MLPLIFILPTLSAAFGAFATAGKIVGRDISSGAANYFSSSWTDGVAKMKYTNGAAGEYSVTWTGNKGNFVVGKGWSTGGAKAVNYSGTFEPNGNAYLSIYGWTTNPLVEYYIVESYGTHNPSNTTEAIQKGNMTSDGGNYEIWTKTRVNKPSIIGTTTFPQFWSIRQSKVVGGTVNTGNHFKAWTSAGLKLGTQNYMIVAVEGQDSNGTATINVGVAPSPTPT
ncbi:Endo-1,4-beta-xylanase A [Lachnellula suecica]|uniref:Endo-1,4-beta-xylanase n=1 Tax=Lachnellula suecica TaxID=602035 RepID=A0A8T9BZE2_9HELO|nr:Endo-1,4-beta-xylanase A [Lachnellula suecica]